MTISTTYLLNVALHAAILSVFASLALLLMRQARYRSVAAIAGLLAVGFLPWLTALRPARPAGVVAPELQARSPALPAWTVVTLPMEREIPKSAEPSAAPPEIVFPDPLTTVVTTWAAGFGIGLISFLYAMLRLRTWRKSLSPPDDAAWEFLRSLSPEIPGRNHFLISPAIASPCVSGFFRSHIVLPRFLLSSASEEELRWAVRHEIAHRQAGDSRWMILFTLIRCANWWNPLVHQLVSRWSDAREQLCDLHAIGTPDRRADYGRFLVAMARKITKQPSLTVAMASRSPARRLRPRIISLLDAEPGAEKSVGKRFVGLSCGLTLCFMALVSCMRVGTDAGGGIAGGTAGAVLSDTKTPLAAAPDGSVTRDWASTESLRRIKITSTLMVTSPDSYFAGGSYTETGVKAIMKRFERIGKTTLVTLPSVIARSDQSTSVRINYEIPESDRRISAAKTKSPVPFVGIHLESLPRLSGPHVVEFRQTVDYRYVPGVWRLNEKNSRPPAGLTSEKIKIITRTMDWRLFSGNTFASSLGEIEPGIYLTLLTKAEILDATGRSVIFPE
ncbi:MAG: M56 family metallopeptidase [Verrucomicrobiota bacterium]